MNGAGSKEIVIWKQGTQEIAKGSRERQKNLEMAQGAREIIREQEENFKGSRSIGTQQVQPFVT